MPRIKKLLGRSTFVGDSLRFLWRKPGLIEVEFRATGRRQLVRYREHGDEYELVSPIARPEIVREAGLLRLGHEILERNRATALVGFRLKDSDGIEAWVRQRAKTMHRDDLIFCAGMLAREADRLRELLTGGAAGESSR
jgi:hypothetical protein